MLILCLSNPLQIHSFFFLIILRKQQPDYLPASQDGSQPMLRMQSFWEAPGYWEWCRSNCTWLVLLWAEFCPLFSNNGEHMLCTKEVFLPLQESRGPCFHLQNTRSLNIVGRFSFSLNSIAYLVALLFSLSLAKRTKDGVFI